ncbi:hypothetical protein KIH41_01010 [Litoribacter ruber]|uniref:hypothetical protein n=1 Tax=Litoribacter ruber TaxID=702568 RepID=UPI001BDB4961|nr:hypothetical protein [Litoribacter ruber]MBT0809854.1 hypothetical protein [Litoribacter ruber]
MNQKNQPQRNKVAQSFLVNALIAILKITSELVPRSGAISASSGPLWLNKLASNFGENQKNQPQRNKVAQSFLVNALIAILKITSELVPRSGAISASSGPLWLNKLASNFGENQKNQPQRNKVAQSFLVNSLIAILKITTERVPRSGAISASSGPLWINKLASNCGENQKNQPQRNKVAQSFLVNSLIAILKITTELVPRSGAISAVKQALIKLCVT